MKLKILRKGMDVMARLTPNATAVINGVTVNEKIIPDGTVWKSAVKAKKAGYPAGSLYKKQQKLCGTGEPKFVTIHNTNDLDNVNDDAEQYTRATYNENMGSARVHFYVDDLGAWQNLKAGTGIFEADPEGSAEVSGHAGDTSHADGGNMTSLSIEIVMNDTPEHDEKAKDNGARLAAWLLYKHGLTVESLVTHTYWVNKYSGNIFDDVDEQCANPVRGQKWCPTYIFASTSKSTALKNWKTFKALVGKYFDVLNSAEESEEAVIYRVQVGAFKKKPYAEAFLETVKAAGFENAFLATSGETAEPEESTKAPDASNDVAIVTLPILSRGSFGAEVKLLQILLNAHGCTDQKRQPLTADGSFGPATQYALATFQSNRNLKADCICGPATWAEIIKMN